MLDPFWKHSGYGHHCQHAARIGPDQVCQLWLPSPNLLPFCQKRSGSYCTKPAQILSGWPGQVLPNHLIQKQANVQESFGLCPISGRIQQAHYKLQTFRLSYILPQMIQVILCRTSHGSNLVLAVSNFGQMDSLEADWCARINRPASGQHFQADLDGDELDLACLVGLHDCTVYITL